MSYKMNFCEVPSVKLPEPRQQIPPSPGLKQKIWTKRGQFQIWVSVLWRWDNFMADRACFLIPASAS